MVKRKRLLKPIILITLMVILFLASIVSLSFAWFTDNKKDDIDISIASISTNESQLGAKIEPSDLVAGNVFDVYVTINLKSDFDIYLRSYATTIMQTVDGDRTDLIELIGVSKSEIGDDNKFYYTNEEASKNLKVITKGENTLQLKFTFKVSELVSEDLFIDKQTYQHDDSLKTKISYNFDYCQVEAENPDILNDWANYQIN